MKSLLRKIVESVRSPHEIPASTHYEILDSGRLSPPTNSAWHQIEVSQKQDQAYQQVIIEMYQGNVRQDLKAAAEAIRFTGIKNPSVLEIGCGSGYYSEVLPYLLRSSIDYVGLDDSKAMIQLACTRYKDRVFVVGDACSIPFEERTFDIVLDGVSLMHNVNYQRAVKEIRRVARSWCIFHTIPLLNNRGTTFLRKKAYGEDTIEVIFNEGEFLQMLHDQGLLVRNVFESVPYDLQLVLEEPTETKTYVCETHRV